MLMDHTHRKKDGVTQIGLDNSWTISLGPHGYKGRRRDGQELGRWSVTEDDISFHGQPHSIGDSHKPFILLKSCLPDDISIHHNIRVSFIFLDLWQRL